MVGLYLAFLAVLTLERLVELRLSRRNLRWAVDRGGVELGQRHFFWMRMLHAAFLGACALEVIVLHRAFSPRIGYPMLALAMLAQGLRYWAIRTLGPRWNVRVVVIPGSPVVTAGPYRFLRHPNYLAVIVEGLAVPLIHGAWLTAVAFSLLNACLLAVRIRCEEMALTQHGQFRERLGNRRRLIPALPAAAPRCTTAPTCSA